MMGSNRWGTAVAFWTLLAGVAVTVLSIVIGNLLPALLPPASRDDLGLAGLGLFLAAHLLSIHIRLGRADKPADGRPADDCPAEPLRLAGHSA